MPIKKTSNKKSIVKKIKYKTHRIKVSCLFSDGQDGGWSITIFPNLKAAEQAKRESIIDRDGFGLEGKELEERIKEEWDNEYDHGYIDTSEIKVRVDENGKVTLAEEIYFHVGQ